MLTAPMTVTEWLTAALTAAKLAAEKAIADHPHDGGTCCLDTPCIKLPRVDDAVIQAASAAAGVRVGEKMDGFWAGYRFVFVPTGGQGSQRSAASGAAMRALEAMLPSCPVKGAFVLEWQQCD